MAGINTGKVVVGAIAAGVVINIVETIMNMFVIAAPMEDMLLALNLPVMGGAAMGGFTVLAFTLGFLVVWTYAAIRPRYGAGPATAMRAGGSIWVAFYLLGNGANWLMGMMTLHLLLITLAYTLPMVLGAAWVGGMVYREE